MGRYAVLGGLVVIVGLDLDLKVGTTLAHHGRVEGLVHVLLGVGDIVVDLAGQGVPQLVDHAQHAVAVGFPFHQHAQGEEIVYFAQLLALGLILLDFAIGAVDVLGTAGNIGIDPLVLQLIAQQLGHLGDVGLAHSAAGGEHPGNLAILIDVQIPEGQVLELPLDFPDTKAVGQGSVNVQGFLGDAALFLGWKGVQRSHVVKAICQLDQDDTDILRHGHQHLAEALGVQTVRVVGAVNGRPERVVNTTVQLGELGDSVHQLGDFRAKPAGDLMQTDAAVLHHIVQQGGGDGLFVQAEV